MMKKGGGLEFLVGFVILAWVFFGAGYVYIQHYQGREARSVYAAEFDAVGGLMVGSPVKINGVNVGEVTQIHLNPKTNFTVFVHFQIKSSLPLPSDTSAIIENDSLVGGSSSLSVVPGSADVVLSPGETIYETRSPSTPSQLMERFLFSSKESAGESHGHGEENLGSKEGEK